MSRLGSAVAVLLVLFSASSAGDAVAGNGGWIAKLRAERDANQASIGQHGDQQHAERASRDGNDMRGWGRGGRNVLRAEQGYADNEASTNQYGGGNVAGIRQFGRGLNATITQDGNGNVATITQWGRGSTAAISQTGSNNAACVIQIGRNVNTDIVQTGGQSTGIIQTRRGSREVPLEFCTNAGAGRGGGWFGAGRR